MTIKIDIKEDGGIFRAKTTISQDLIRKEMRKGTDFTSEGAGAPNKRECLLDTLTMLQRTIKKGQLDA